MKRPARVPSQLPESLHKRLNMYALAASAAGVSLLALPQAEAKVIYTPANIKINPYHWYYLDINHDGVRDFTLHNWLLHYHTCDCQTTLITVIPKEQGNQIWGVGNVNPRRFGNYASDLSSGVRIGSDSKLAASNTLMWYLGSNLSLGTHRSRGLWKNAKNRYLGLKFVVKGTATHYGWARLSLIPYRNGHTTLVLTGYAYETIPNKSIKAGQTHSGNEIAPDASTLGALARGVR